MYCLLELWPVDPDTGFSRFREHIVHSSSVINRLLAEVEAPFVALGPDFYYSQFYRKATKAIINSRQVKAVWQDGPEKRLVISSELIKQIGLLSESESIHEGIKELIERILQLRTCAALEFTKHANIAESEQSKSEKKRVLFYTPFGNWLVHSQVDAVLATALSTRDAEVKVAGCDGLFQKFCYLTLHEQDREAACNSCSATSKAFFSKFNLPLTQLSEYISKAQIKEIRDWAEAITIKDLLTVTYKGLPVGRWAAPTTASYFRVPTRVLQSDEVRPVFIRYIADVVITFTAVSNLIDAYKPHQIVMYSGCASLYRAALEAARCKGVDILTHERGMINGSFVLASQQDTGNPLPVQNMIDAWKDVALNTAELEEIRSYYIGREYGQGLNYPTFYPFKTEHTDILRKLNIPADAKIVSYFSSSEHETIYWHGFKKVERQLEVIDTIIDIFSKRKEYLVIRHHPNIGGMEVGRPDYAFLSRAYEQAFRAPKNVRIIMPHEEITSYALLWYSDAAIGSVTTMANEVAARAIPCASFDIAYLAEGVSHRVSSFERADLEKLIDDLLDFKTKIGVRDLQKIYRYTNALYRKLSTHFKNMRIENGQAMVNIQSLSDLTPGHCSSLDRVCNHILKREPLLLLPTEAERSRSEAEELEFFQRELTALSNYKAEVRSRTIQPNPVGDLVMLRTTLSSDLRNETLFRSWLSNQRVAPSSAFALTLKNLSQWPAEIALTLERTPQTYALVAVEGIAYDPAFISSSIDCLNTNPTKSCVLWGSWIANETGRIIGDILGRDTALNSARDFTSKIPWYSGGPLLLGFAVWRKEALLSLLTNLAKLNSEIERNEYAIKWLTQEQVMVKRKPLSVINAPMQVRPLENFDCDGRHFTFRATSTLPHNGEIGSKVIESSHEPHSTKKSMLEIERAVDMLRNNLNTEALVIIDQAIPQLPNMPILFYAKAVAHVRIGQVSDAVESLKKLLQFEPEHPQGKALLTDIVNSVR